MWINLALGFCQMNVQLFDIWHFLCNYAKSDFHHIDSPKNWTLWSSFSLFPVKYSVWNLFLELVHMQFQMLDHYIHMRRQWKVTIRTKWMCLCVCMNVMKPLSWTFANFFQCFVFLIYLLQSLILCLWKECMDWVISVCFSITNPCEMD